MVGPAMGARRRGRPRPPAARRVRRHARLPRPLHARLRLGPRAPRRRAAEGPGPRRVPRLPLAEARDEAPRDPARPARPRPRRGRGLLGAQRGAARSDRSRRPAATAGRGAAAEAPLPDVTLADASVDLGDVRLVLSVRPGRPRVREEPLPRPRRGRPARPSPLEEGRLSFEMTMPMGDHRYTLVPGAEGWQEAEVVLPLCKSGKRRWFATVEGTVAGKPRTARFQLDLTPPSRPPAPLIETIGLLGFLTLGLLGGFGHCVGMCSPFVLFVSRRYAPPDGRGAPRGRAALAPALVHGRARPHLRRPRRPRGRPRRRRPARRRAPRPPARRLRRRRRASSSSGPSSPSPTSSRASTAGGSLFAPRRRRAQGARPRPPLRHRPLPRPPPLRPPLLGRHRRRRPRRRARGRRRPRPLRPRHGPRPPRRLPRRRAPRPPPRVPQPALAGVPAGDGGVVPLDGAEGVALRTIREGFLPASTAASSPLDESLADPWRRAEDALLRACGDARDRGTAPKGDLPLSSHPAPVGVPGLRPRPAGRARPAP